jgi:hypothetical protein
MRKFVSFVAFGIIEQSVLPINLAQFRVSV